MRLPFQDGGLPFQDAQHHGALNEIERLSPLLCGGSQSRAWNVTKPSTRREGGLLLLLRLVSQQDPYKVLPML